MAVVDYQDLTSPFSPIDWRGVIFNRDIGRPQREFVRLMESRKIPVIYWMWGVGQEKKVFINFPLR